MITAIITFLGGVAGRMMLEHLFSFITKWQDNKNELARLQLQGQLDDSAHKRNMESIQTQAALGIKVIEAQTAGHLAELDAEAFSKAVEAAGKPTGITWVDAWNGIIRPLLASMCIALWTLSLIQRHMVLDDWDRSLMSLALGVFVGGRIQLKGG